MPSRSSAFCCCCCSPAWRPISSWCGGPAARVGHRLAAGIVVPFACGFALGELLPDSHAAGPGKRLITSLFLGTALSISSVKIVAMVVREMNFMRRDVGQVIVASAIIDDTIGWIIIAIIFGLALQGTVDALVAWRKACSARSCSWRLSLTIGRRARVHHHPLDQRQLRQRIRGHHGDPGDHGRDGADHRI